MEVAHPQSGSSSTSLLVELEFGNAGFRGERKTKVPGEKPLGAKERTNTKLNPHLALTPGFECGPHWWEASALTTVPSLPLYFTENSLKITRNFTQKGVAVVTSTKPYICPWREASSLLPTLVGPLKSVFP